MAQPGQPAPAAPAPTRSKPRESGYPAWLIASGILLALAVIFMIGFGFGQAWGASQWGPFSAWLSSGLTLAAVVVALRGAALARREAARNQRSRLIDHEISRRRENIDALSDLWGALASMTIPFTNFLQYLDDLPHDLRKSPSLEQLADQIVERYNAFLTMWAQTVEPPMFKALLLLRGNPMYPPVKQLNADIRTLTEQTLPAMNMGIFQDRRPDTGPVYAAWKDIAGRRNAHLNLAHEHLSLSLGDVERALDQDAQTPSPHPTQAVGPDC